VRCDEAGTARVVPRALTFEWIVQEAFDPIRRHGARDPAVAMRILDSLARIAEASPPSAHPALRRQATLVRADALRAGMSGEDEEQIDARQDRVLRLTAL
jgi:uncharacterized membrane protein